MILYKINNLKCSYDGSGELLHINHLTIELGKVYFILGKSGVGKSTLIEALGLMNDTVHPDSTCQFNIENTFHDIYKLWNYPSKLRAKIREKYFSFLFQSPNLLDYYSAGENMAFPLLISGLSLKEAKEIINELVVAFELPSDVFTRNVTHLSGGQQQRVAFIRALVGEYKILLADEPTGNLDWETGDTLFKTLRQHIKRENKTAIIVSHDTELAHKYGDYIYSIYQNESGANTGKLIHDNVSSPISSSINLLSAI